MTPRPPAPSYTPDGYAWLPTVAGEEWTTRPDVVRDRRCRYTSRGWMHGEPAAAVLFRGSFCRPYGYCAEHLYGKWIEDGQVMGWRLAPVLP